MNVGLFSYSAALVAYLLLTALLVTAWRGRLMGLVAVVAVTATAVWATLNLIIAVEMFLPLLLLATVELIRTGAWLFFLVHILVADADREVKRRWLSGVWILIAGAAFLTVVLPEVVGWLALGANTLFLVWTLLAITGLLLVEQVFRNRRADQRAEIKHLCLGLGAVFIYDLFFYADALLMQRTDPQLWEARGLVNALIVPLIAVSAARNPSWSLEVCVSRHVVFHSATLSGAGIYLTAMAAAGYYIRYFGGTWGALLQIAFLFIAIIALILLLFSAQLRARLRVLLNRHFFSLKYDYREEWLRFTAELSRPGVNVPEAVVTALGAIVGSTGGMLWINNEQGAFTLIERVKVPAPNTLLQRSDQPLVQFLVERGWIIDLVEYRAVPELYNGFVPPSWLEKTPTAWLIIPLFFRNELGAFAVLTNTDPVRRLNWEDRSLLKTAGHQAASYVAQYRLDQALMRARQFEAFSQLSAYVAHDLKNLLAQQSLLIANAEKHKHNPAFVDDMIHTVKNSVTRMERLMQQLRTGARSAPATSVQLDELLDELALAYSDRQPTPQVLQRVPGLHVDADRERLRTVLGHLLQNAQDATPPTGQVWLRLQQQGNDAVIEIEDTGTGMSPEFICERLFRPFDSTKGLTGMGIGAFESREFIRSLGGTLNVHSQLGQGTVMQIVLPHLK
ncbi:histidine kinase [Chromatium okenii]|uniref:XrtA/PEP-CTERM system histidine kinase PrsK n=1 Tax=Chromatium okenii TaxID=61644 RepID=UPI0019075694|nr:XrtA/PEP-CTERM system histidine kinase PrsK [Chromatium okenii]MBK1640329.1 histidine kinase [Chromatium okenii]